MKFKIKFDCAGAMVLGMHDALVSITGLLAGLAFTPMSQSEIILTGIIASVSAALSMGASNYLAQRADQKSGAFITALYTGITFMITCILLILPFLVISSRFGALMATFAVAIAIILMFNLCAARAQKTPFWPRFLEMLVVCIGISIITFFIGQTTQYVLNI